MAKAKLKLGYDNLDDAKVKLYNTICLYKGEPIVVKVVDYDPEHNEKFVLKGMYMNGGARAAETPKISIDDPDFNCSDYNIGYINYDQYGFAAWYYRTNQKQYSQGLKYNQLAAKASNQAYLHAEMRGGKPVIAMLKNEYPTFDKAADILRKGDTSLVAFNKNFAMAKDVIHNDFLLEYKGVPIGFTPDLKSLNLLKAHEHLYEALKEAIG